MQNFSGIFALKFCEFRRFFSRQKPAFLFTAKNQRQRQFTAPRSYMSYEVRKKLAELRRRTFFFLQIKLKQDKKNEKIFHPRSRTPQELRHFHIEFRTFALFPAFLQEVKT